MEKKPIDDCTISGQYALVATAIYSFFFMLTSVLVAPAFALDLNSFRAEHKLPPLSYSATLAGAAYGHAQDMAQRNSLDHNGFKDRAKLSGGTAAENVSWGCDDEDCAIKQWAKSAGHRRNMLMTGVSAWAGVGDSGQWTEVLGDDAGELAIRHPEVRAAQQRVDARLRRTMRRASKDERPRNHGPSPFEARCARTSG